MAEAAMHLEQGSGRLAGVCPQGGKTGLPAFVRREEKRLADTIGIGWHLGSRSILSRGISRANKK